MNADELIAKLRDNAICEDCEYYGEPCGCNRPAGQCVEYDLCNEAADLIESLQAQFAKEKRRAERAVADIYHMGGCPNCIYNKGRHPDTGLPMCAILKEFPDGQCFKWRGDAEEGD